MLLAARDFALILPLGLATLALACSDDGVADDEAGETMGADMGDTGDGDTSTTGDGDTGSTDTGDTGSTDTGDTGSTDTGDTGTDTGDTGSTDTGSETGNNQTGLSLVLFANSNVVLEANNGGALAAECLLFEDGLPALAQPDVLVDVAPVEGATEIAEGWEFPEFGTWTLSCAATVDGQDLYVEREIAVLNDSLDPRLAGVGAGLGQSARGLAAVLAADGQADQLLVDAVTELEQVEPALTDLALADLDDLLRPIPGGYPTPAELEQAGIMANADDDALAGSLAEVEAALDNLAATYAGFDANLEPTQADLDQLEAAGADLDAALADMAALEPTAHGWLANRDALALLIRDHLVPTLNAVDGYVIDRAKIEAAGLFGIAPPEPGLSPKFGLLSLSLGMFNQSYIRVKLVNEWYGDVIAELDKSINNLILNDLIDYFLPPNPNGPIIDIFQASASIGFAVPGYDTWAYGSYFNSDPAFNVFIILGDQWQGVVDSIIDLCGVSDENTVPENVDAMQGCIEQMEQAVDSSINYPMEVIEPGLLGDQDVHLGPFPMACDGFLPVATLVIPVNLAVGRGETWLTNCLP